MTEPQRAEVLLLGPGPSNVAEPVRRSMARPMIGHLDPDFLALLDEVQSMLRAAFRTGNRLTLPVSATGSAGMETCLVNLLEPGDTALVGVNGVFGERMVSIVERCGARAVRVEAPMGEILPPARMIQAIDRERPDLVAFVHAETSTGVAQPVPDIARAARDSGALCVLDCVTSLGGMPVEIDAWGIDAAYSGTQKCLSCPPGLSPVTFGQRAWERVERRRQPVQSWYLDLTLIGRYFGEERVYHHTAPVSMIFALHEALRAVFDEGLEARWSRHRRTHERLVAGLEQRGFRMLVEPEARLPMLNTVLPPTDDEASIRRRLLENHRIEVGGGLGKLAGRVWRIGLMGHNARDDVVDALLGALDSVLAG